MHLMTAAEKRVEQKESMLLFIESSEYHWANTARRVLAKIQEERIQRDVFVTVNITHHGNLLKRGFWTMLEAEGYTILVVEGGVTVGW